MGLTMMVAFSGASGRAGYGYGRPRCCGPMTPQLRSAVKRQNPTASGKAFRDSLRRPTRVRVGTPPAGVDARPDAKDRATLRTSIARTFALGLNPVGMRTAAFPRLGLGERVRPFRIAIASISRRAARDRCDGDAEGARGPVLVESTGAPACNRAGVDNRPLTRSRLTGSGNGSGVRSVCRADLPVVMRFTCGTDFAYFAVVRRCAAA